MAATTAAATLSAVKTALSKKMPLMASAVSPVLQATHNTATTTTETASTAAIQYSIHNEPIVQCRWWNGEMMDIIDPSLYRMDGGGKLKEDDLDPESLMGQEMREKFATVGLIHVQNTVRRQAAILRSSE
jgi:hypothetical protein